MNTEKIKVENGGFVLNDGLPDEFYALAEKDISVTVEKNGGINSIKIWDIFYHNGKPYPDANPTPPVIQKSGNKCGIRPLYGPGIRFVSECHTGDDKSDRRFYHFPGNAVLYPFGFTSHSAQSSYKLEYDLLIHDQSMICRLGNNAPERHNLMMIISKDHFRHGKMPSVKNYVAYEMANPHSQSWRPMIKSSGGDGAFPFHEKGEYDLDWEKFELAQNSDFFEIRGLMKFSYLKKTIHIVIKADRPLKLEETRDRYILKWEWDTSSPEDKITVCMAFDENRDSAIAKANTHVKSFKQILNEKIQRNVRYSNFSTQINISSIPEASAFAKTIIPFEKAMIVGETANEACIRPAMDKYGFLPLWDQIWPAKAFICAGDFETAKKLVNYMLTLPDDKQLFMNDLILILCAEEIFTFTGDTAYLSGIWQELKEIFLLLNENSDPETRLLSFNSTCGVDDPGELGLEGMIWPSCLNGWWFGVCRAMENMALLTGDSEIAACANLTGNKIYKNYMRIFLNQKKGYLSVAVEPGTLRQSPVCQNVSTLGMDCPYGEYLLHSHIFECAEYQANALYHPMGRSSVALDDDAYESWKNAYMFQHLAHEAKTARAAGRGDEALRITQTYFNIFRKTLTAIETYNLNGCEKDITQRADWQAFGARGAYGALIEGVAGIQWDAGGFQYVPCEVSGDISLSDFKFRNTIWDIAIKGEGAYCNDIIIDGQKLPGTMKIPAKFLTDSNRHSLVIERTNTPFYKPVLLSALNASIEESTSCRERLKFSILNEAHTTLKIYSPVKPVVRVNDIETDYEWDEKKSVLWLDIMVKDNTSVSVSI